MIAYQIHMYGDNVALVSVPVELYGDALALLESVDPEREKLTISCNLDFQGKYDNLEDDDGRS